MVPARSQVRVDHLLSKGLIETRTQKLTLGTTGGAAPPPSPGAPIIELILFFNPLTTRTPTLGPGAGRSLPAPWEQQGLLPLLGRCPCRFQGACSGPCELTNNEKYNLDLSLSVDRTSYGARWLGSWKLGDPVGMFVDPY